MAANQELTDRTPVFFVAASTEGADSSAATYADCDANWLMIRGDIRTDDGWLLSIG